MPMLMHLNDPEDELCEANQLAWEEIACPEHDEGWEGELEEVDEAIADNVFMNPSEMLDSEQFEEPEDIYISENIDLQDVDKDSDLLQ
jgi:hypothetical protein